MILAVSRDCAEYLLQMGTPPQKVHVAYDHLDTGSIRKRLELHRTSGSKALPFGASHPVVGIIGRITAYKQQDLFLRAIPFVLAGCPDARFVVVGSAIDREKEYERGLRELAQRLGIANQVTFMGYRQDAVEIMSELCACCLTSAREPFPRTILEAQFIGCPVVASNTGGCPEMVQDGLNGLLFPVASINAPENLASQVLRLLKDRPLAAGLSRRAQQELETGLSTITPVLQFERLLYSLAKT